MRNFGLQGRLRKHRFQEVNGPCGVTTWQLCVELVCSGNFIRTKGDYGPNRSQRCLQERQIGLLVIDCLFNIPRVGFASFVYLVPPVV